MYERVLATLDGSDLAETILPYVEELVKKLGSELVLLHVVPSVESLFSVPVDPIAPTPAVNTVEIHDAAVRAGHEYLEAVKARLDAAGVPAQAMLVEGGAATAILEYVEREAPSIIAMATHGRGGLSRLVMGSVADEVVKKSRVPVLLLRPPEQQ